MVLAICGVRGIAPVEICILFDSHNLIGLNSERKVSYRPCDAIYIYAPPLANNRVVYSARRVYPYLSVTPRGASRAHRDLQKPSFTQTSDRSCVTWSRALEADHRSRRIMYLRPCIDACDHVKGGHTCKTLSRSLAVSICSKWQGHIPSHWQDKCNDPHIMHSVAERLTPAPQCTSTAVWGDYGEEVKTDREGKTGEGIAAADREGRTGEGIAAADRGGSSGHMMHRVRIVKVTLSFRPCIFDKLVDLVEMLADVRAFHIWHLEPGRKQAMWVIV